MLAVAGGEGLTAVRRLPGFPGDPCFTEMRSKQKLEKEKGMGVWALDELPWQWPGLWGGNSQGHRAVTCSAMCPPRSRESELSLPGSAAVWLVTVHTGPGASSCSLSSCVLCVCVPLSMSSPGGSRKHTDPSLDEYISQSGEGLM